MSKGKCVLNPSAVEYYTPKEVVEVFGNFDYDPATTPEQAEHLGISTFDTVESDGLKSDWTDYKSIWINPPFKEKFKFLAKAMETLKSAPDTRICFLCPIESLTTKAFHRIVGLRPYTLYVPDGRIKFKGLGDNLRSPAFGSVVLEFSQEIFGRQVVHIPLK